MDEGLEHKIRDLKLRILRIEKEIAATQHNANLGGWLRAGHPSQIAKNAERERKRLDEKLADLRAKLEVLAPGSTPAPKPVKIEPAPPPQPPAAMSKSAPVKIKTEKEEAEKHAAVKESPAKTAKAPEKTKAPAKPVKKAATGKAAASKTTKKTGRK